MKASNVVQETRDYSKFKLIGANRGIVPGHVDNLKKAFEEYGNLTRVQPILVNEKFEIIDGQHRFDACFQLGEPIFYTQVPGLRIRDAVNMNVLHRGWLFNDYAKSYAESGDKQYQRFLELQEDYGFSNGTMLNYIVGEENGSKNYKAFRSGEFTIKDPKGAVQRLEMLAELVEFLPQAKANRPSRAFLVAIQAPGYKQSHMIKKVALFGDRLFKTYYTSEDNLRMFEEIYNYKSSAGTRTRLY